MNDMNYTALVTGASRGVGLALVQLLLEKEYRVFAGYHHTPGSDLEQLQAKFEEKLTLVHLDIGSDESVRKAAAVVKEGTDRLDLLLNNAGILGEIEESIKDDINYEDMLKVYNVNALGALRVTQALVPLVMNSSAKMIVNISSEAGSIGQNGRRGWFAYCMSKAALNMESSLVHNGLKDDGGRVLVVHPGWVQTYMRGELDAAADLTPAESASKIIALVMDRIGNAPGSEPEYIDVYGNKLPW